MQIRSGMGRTLAWTIHTTIALIVTAAVCLPALATEFVGTDINGGNLLYITSPKTSLTITTTGAKPDGVVVGPYQNIIYVLSGAGEVHYFNPYTHTDTTLAKGLTTPVDLVMEPGCKSILVSDIGVNKILRISLTTGAVTTLYGGDQIRGMTYDNLGNLYVNDDTQSAILQIDPTTGMVLNQTSSANPLTTLEDIAFDTFTGELFASSTTGQLVYEVTANLLSINQIAFTQEPFLHGIVSDGAGHVYVVGSDGTTGEILQYTINSGVQTVLNKVTGLEDIWLIPLGPCIKAHGIEVCGD